MEYKINAQSKRLCIEIIMGNGGNVILDQESSDMEFEAIDEDGNPQTWTLLGAKIVNDELIILGKNENSTPQEFTELDILTGEYIWIVINLIMYLG